MDGAAAAGTVLDTGWAILWQDLSVEISEAGETRVVHVRDALLFTGQAGDDISVLVAPGTDEAIRAGFSGMFDLGVYALVVAIMAWLLWKIIEISVP